MILSATSVKGSPGYTTLSDLQYQLKEPQGCYQKNKKKCSLYTFPGVCIYLCYSFVNWNMLFIVS